MREQKHDIVDQGWAAMQRILDQEMPRRRRRVAGWWWFAGLLLLPILGMAGWQLYQQPKPIVPKSATPALPVAPLAEHTPTRIPHGHNSPSTGSSKGSMESVTMSTKLPKFGKRPFVGISSTQPAEIQPSLDKKAGIPAKEIPMGAVLTAMALPNVVAERTSVLKEIDTAPFAALAALPTPLPLLTTEGTKPSLLTCPSYTNPDTKKKVAHRPTFAWGLVAGITSERLPRVNGGMVGLVTDWQPLRRWGLRSGVQYAMQRLAADESLVTAISEDAYAKYSDGLSLIDQSGNYGNIAQFPNINTNILASVRRIHRVETPLLAYWQPAQKLRAYAGASLNYTFLAQVSPHIFNENQVFKVVSGRDELNRLATEKLNRWQVKWQLGLGYRIGRQVEINAGIQTALPKISLQKDAALTMESQDASRNIVSIEQVRQMAVHLRGVVFF